MQQFFTKSFFRLLVGFLAIIAIGFSVITAVNVLNASQPPVEAKIPAGESE
jgi:hypothetical protein